MKSRESRLCDLFENAMECNPWISRVKESAVLKNYSGMKSGVSPTAFNSSLPASLRLSLCSAWLGPCPLPSVVRIRAMLEHYKRGPHRATDTFCFAKRRVNQSLVDIAKK